MKQNTFKITVYKNYEPLETIELLKPDFGPQFLAVTNLDKKFTGFLDKHNQNVFEFSGFPFETFATDNFTTFTQLLELREQIKGGNFAVKVDPKNRNFEKAFIDCCFSFEERCRFQNELRAQGVTFNLENINEHFPDEYLQALKKFANQPLSELALACDLENALHHKIATYPQKLANFLKEFYEETYLQSNSHGIVQADISELATILNPEATIVEIKDWIGEALILDPIDRDMFKTFGEKSYFNSYNIETKDAFEFGHILQEVVATLPDATIKEIHQKILAHFAHRNITLQKVQKGETFSYGYKTKHLFYLISSYMKPQIINKCPLKTKPSTSKKR